MIVVQIELHFFVQQNRRSSESRKWVLLFGFNYLVDGIFHKFIIVER
jgi:hypothetical protein